MNYLPKVYFSSSSHLGDKIYMWFSHSCLLIDSHRYSLYNEIVFILFLKMNYSEVSSTYFQVSVYSIGC